MKLSEGYNAPEQLFYQKLLGESISSANISVVQNSGKRQDFYLGSFKVDSQRKHALAGREMRGPGWNGPLSLRMLFAEAAAHHSTLVKNFPLSRRERAGVRAGLN